MGGIQRRRRRMRQHQPVTSPGSAPEDQLEPAPATEAGGTTEAGVGVRAEAVAETVDVAEVEPVRGPPVTAKPHPPIPRPPLHPPTSAPPASGPPAYATSEPAAQGEPAAPSEPAAAHGESAVPTSGAGSDAPTSGAGSDAPRPSPHHLAELSGAFAMTASVHDPEPADGDPPPAPRSPRDDDHDADHHHHHHDAHHHHEEVVSERGLRGLVGGGASQVSVSAAMRARDAARPTEEDLAAADRDLQIIRRGWVPREELTRPGRRSPTS